jgi:hypothetical protein
VVEVYRRFRGTHCLVQQGDHLRDVAEVRHKSCKERYIVLCSRSLRNGLVWMK